MQSIIGIITTAGIIVGSIVVIVAGGFGLFAYYTATGQEEGE